MADQLEHDAGALKTERIVGAVVAAAGIATALWLIPAQTEPTPTAALPARAMPTLAAIGIAVCGLVQAFRPIAGSAPVRDTAGKTMLAVVICAITWIGLAYVGFAVTAPVLVLGLMLMMGERRPLWLVIGGVALPALIWTIFEIVLRRPLP